MSEPPTKRRRTSANPYLDLEAAVDRDDEPEGREDESDGGFIDDGSEQEEEDEDGGPREDNATLQARSPRNQQRLVEFLQEEGHLDLGGAPEDDEHAGLLREMLVLDIGGGNSAANLLVVDDDDDDDDDGVFSVPRPLWAELGHANAAVSGALDTCQDDDDERRISPEDTLYEVSCTPGMEETIAFRIFSWAMQVDSLGPTQHHVLAGWAVSNSPSPNSGSARTRTVLARSAIANPYLRGRVYIESEKIGYVQRLARRVRGLNPASVRPVTRDLLLRPLLMTRHSYPDRTFVRLLDPPCPTMTCLIVEDQLLMVPAVLHSSQNPPVSAIKFNADIHAMPAPPSESRDGNLIWDAQYVSDSSSIRVDKHGFRYYPLKMLGPTSLEAYEPSVSEIEITFKFGLLNSRHYHHYMSRIMSYSFSTGDRVIFQSGSFQSLIGSVLILGSDDTCSIYIPSQGSIVQAARQQLRRHFCIGDRVSAVTDDVVEKLGNRTGWVVGVSDGYKAAWSSVEGRDPITGQSRTQAGYRVDLTVFSPESGKEVIAAHYEFQFEDHGAISLQTIPPLSPVSEMGVGIVYTVTIPLNCFRSQSFLGVIAAIEGVRTRRPGTEGSTELGGIIVFSIWDNRNQAPYGYPPNWIETVSDFSGYDISLGATVTLKDQEGRCGTARITKLGTREISLGNFTGALKFADLESGRKFGPYDCHVGKTVRVAKGPFKGGVGLVQAVNAVGICTVELTVQPIRRITISLKHLTAVDESHLYMSLVPTLAPPPRPCTPPAPETSSDTPLAFQVSSTDVNISANLPQPPDLNCRWLVQPFAQQMPIKLEPINHKMQRPYHFLATFYDNASEVPRLMVRVLDRQKQREFAADELKWLPASDINQTVVRITGEDGGTLYWTVIIDRDNCQVRRVPSKSGAPLLIFPRLELAQVNAKRTRT